MNVKVRRWVAVALTWQGMYESVHLLHIPLGGVTGQKVLHEEGQLSAMARPLVLRPLRRGSRGP